MRKLFQFLKPYAPRVLLILCVLVVQAYCDLSLPTYTSNIVNVGIQQSGIDEEIPENISEEEMNRLRMQGVKAIAEHCRTVFDFLARLRELPERFLYQSHGYQWWRTF